jgi:predicted amidophosphoribosyltransferase
VSTYVPPPTAGFGSCGKCPYMATGPAAVCSACATETLQPAAPYSCPICGQALDSADARCRNTLCTSPTRAFEYNRAIAMKTGELEAAIWSHKYQGRWGWGMIFARVLLGYLYQHSDLAAADLIIPMPTYNPTNLPRRGNDHAGWVIENAMEENEHGYQFQLEPPVIVKTMETPRMVATSNAGERRAAASQLYDALVVPDPPAVQGTTVVVYDDVFTSGSTLNAVATRLREARAAQVIGLTLARAPWQ